jgi:hypothetical protein
VAHEVPVEGGFEGGHGSHWDAILEDPGELSRVVAEVYKRGTTQPPIAAALGAEGLVDVRFRALAFGGGAFEVRLVEASSAAGGKPRIVTVYPHLMEAAAPLGASAVRVTEWGAGAFEAIVQAALAHDGSSLGFFATDYFGARAAYRSGGPFALALSAIAYTCGTIAEKERLEAFAGGHVDVSRSTLVAPLKDSERAPYYDDDYFLQGPVASCEPFMVGAWGHAALLRLDLGGLGRVPVLARAKDFPHGWPRPGEFVAAYAWLQGRIDNGPK